MFETYMMGEQQLREMALNAMLLAVDAQAAALKSMDKEHSFGIENSFSVERLRAECKDLVQAAHAIVKNAEANCLNDTRDKITALAVSARKLKDGADRFQASASPRAKSRYDHLLMQMGMEVLQQGCADPEAVKASEAEAGKAPTNTEIAGDVRKLSAQAGFACLRAELDECRAYAMQIHATCNLALEYALKAAAKSARCNSNI